MTPLASVADYGVDVDAAVSVTLRTAVVIPCRDEAPYVERLLDAIRAQDRAVDEVIIVDGGSADGTMEIVQRYGASHPGFPLRVVDAHGANISAALNAGISASRSDVIVRMDAHARPAADYIRRAVCALDETAAAVVGGLWKISPGGRGRVAAAISRAVAHPMGAGDAAYRIASEQAPERRRVDTVPFGCFRRAHWQRIGGYNEQLLVNEDYEFNYRTRESGGGVLLDTRIHCEYFSRATLGALARQYFRYGWWKGRMLRQHPESIRLRQAVPALFLPGWIVLAALAAAIPVFRPAVAVLLGAYAVALVVAGLHASVDDWPQAVPAAAAFLTIHTAWSAGISSFFLTGASATARRRPGGRRPRAGLTGPQLIAALFVIAMLSSAVPWAMATRVSARRIARADADVSAIARSLRSADLSRPAERDTVLVGPGADPHFPPDSDWRAVRAVTPSAGQLGFEMPIDPWGNHYVIYPESAAPRARWVLSAGPNGILETPFRQDPQHAAVSGDDIGFQLR